MVAPKARACIPDTLNHSEVGCYIPAARISGAFFSCFSLNLVAGAQFCSGGWCRWEVSLLLSPTSLKAGPCVVWAEISQRRDERLRKRSEILEVTSALLLLS